ncbi:13714_t:CDS:2, partial [Entrophospora sp. SA101]
SSRNRDNRYEESDEPDSPTTATNVIKFFSNAHAQFNDHFFQRALEENEKMPNAISTSYIDEFDQEELTDEEYFLGLSVADIINLSDKKTLADDEMVAKLKKEANSNPPPCINSAYLKRWFNSVYENDIENSLKKLKKDFDVIDGFDTSESDLIKDIIRIKLLQLRADHGKINKHIDENTYTSILISMDFEFLRLHFPGLISSSWNENEVPSSKWRREKIYNDSDAMARKADGILFNYNCRDQELFIFENIGPPEKTNNPKYLSDKLKCFRNCADSIFKTFYNGNGNIKYASKFYVLAYIVYKTKGELFRVNLAAPETFAVDKIMEIEYPFEHVNIINIIKVIELVFMVKKIIELNNDTLYNYKQSCIDIDKYNKDKFIKVKEWLSYAKT